MLKVVEDTKYWDEVLPSVEVTYGNEELRKSFKPGPQGQVHKDASCAELEEAAK